MIHQMITLWMYAAEIFNLSCYIESENLSNSFLTISKFIKLNKVLFYEVLLPLDYSSFLPLNSFNLHC